MVISLKRFLSIIAIFLFFSFMLCFPNKTFTGASNGLLLWFQIILPTLLPFIILSNLLVYSHALNYFSHLLGPIFCKLFHVSKPACHAILMGFLCGYPMGAKSINDLMTCNYISRTEAQYLLSFCNNASPMFMISFIVSSTFSDMTYTLGTLCILMMSPILCSFLFRLYYKIPNIPFEKIILTIRYDNKVSLRISEKVGFKYLTEVHGKYRKNMLVCNLHKHVFLKILK